MSRQDEHSEIVCSCKIDEGNGDMGLVAIIYEDCLLAVLSGSIDVWQEMCLNELVEQFSIRPACVTHLVSCSW